MDTLFIQGRSVAPEQLESIRQWIREHPDWGRFRLSQHIAEQWNWRNAAGRLKDMAARTLLLKLERRALLQLPKRRRAGGNRPAPVREAKQRPLLTEPLIQTRLDELLPLRFTPVDGLPERQVLAGLLSQHHYLDYRRPVGQNLQYLVGDRSGRLLAGLVFGAAAWKCAPRDQYIGWDSRTRELHLHLVANNMRWLVLPWVRVPQLASHLLGLVAARISSDWQNKYGHRIYLLETFVERARFSGACYQAAQWIALGSTQGRSRNDSDRLLQVPCKEVYVYPLTPSFRNHLCSSHQPTYRPTEAPIHGPVDSLPS
jgi:Domain of unknown function (DUF4338)